MLAADFERGALWSQQIFIKSFNGALIGLEMYKISERQTTKLMWALHDWMRYIVYIETLKTLPPANSNQGRESFRNISKQEYSPVIQARWGDNIRCIVHSFSTNMKMNYTFTNIADVVEPPVILITCNILYVAASVVRVQGTCTMHNVCLTRLLFLSQQLRP